MSNMMLTDFSLSSQKIPDVIKKDQHDEEGIKKATNEFTKMFLRTALSQMFNEDESSSYFGDSHAGQMWKHMWVDQLSDACVGHTGLEPSIEKAISRKIGAYKNRNEENGVTIHETA